MVAIASGNSSLVLLTPEREKEALYSSQLDNKTDDFAIVVLLKLAFCDRKGWGTRDCVVYHDGILLALPA